RRVTRETGRTPIIIADHYQSAALAAYYLPGHPVVYNAEHLMGGRRSAYDAWGKTNLRLRNVRGRPVVLVGKSSRPWCRALRLRTVERINPDLAVAHAYDG